MADQAEPSVGNEHLLWIEDRDGKRCQQLEALKYFIGRDIANDICLNSQFASRYHASLLRVPGAAEGIYGYRILDGDLEGKPSTNGLLVNGQKVRVHQLQAGDVVTFGPDAKVTYELASASDGKADK